VLSIICVILVYEYYNFCARVNAGKSSSVRCWLSYLLYLVVGMCTRCIEKKMLGVHGIMQTVVFFKLFLIRMLNILNDYAKHGWSKLTKK